MAPLLEIAVFNAPSAIIAATSGASRIELCTSMPDGGLTPSLQTLQSLTSTLRETPAIPVHIMIRPHASSFVYSALDLENMKADMKAFIEYGVAAFVFGVLDDRGLVDVEANKALLAAASGRPCTFHRAFDEIPQESMEEQLEILVELGFAAVLTSGGGKMAWEGREILKVLVGKAEGKIDVIVGGGVRSGGLRQLREVVCSDGRGEGVVWHSSAIVDEGTEVCSKEEVRSLRNLLDS